MNSTDRLTPPPQEPIFHIEIDDEEPDGVIVLETSKRPVTAMPYGSLDELNEKIAKIYHKFQLAQKENNTVTTKLYFHILESLKTARDFILSKSGMEIEDDFLETAEETHTGALPLFEKSSDDVGDRKEQPL